MRDTIRAEPVTIQHSVYKVMSGTFQIEYSHATKRINRLDVTGAKGRGILGFCQQWNDGNRKDQNHTRGQGVSKEEETEPGAVVNKAVEEVWSETMIAVSQTKRKGKVS